MPRGGKRLLRATFKWRLFGRGGPSVGLIPPLVLLNIKKKIELF